MVTIPIDKRVYAAAIQQGAVEVDVPVKFEKVYVISATEMENYQRLLKQEQHEEDVDVPQEEGEE